MTYPLLLSEDLVLPYPSRDGKLVRFDSLFRGVTVLLLQHEFTCPLERLGAHKLNEYKPCFDKMGVKMALLCHDAIGARQFVEGGNWDSEIRLDLDRLIGTEPSKPINSKVLPFKHKGEPRGVSELRLGGTYIVNSDSRVIYAHEPIARNDYPCTGMILQICRSWTLAATNPISDFPPSNLHDLSFSEPSCTQDYQEDPRLNQSFSGQSFSEKCRSRMSIGFALRSNEKNGRLASCRRIISFLS